MPGKSPAPEKIIEAVTLRAAGHTIVSISDRTGISVRTLNRVFERHTAKKGEVSYELVLAAKRDLIQTITSDDRIKEETARLVADDLAHARLLRQRMADATEKLVADDLEQAVLVMRAAAAYSTALKNTSDLFRHTLRIERALDAEKVENLPELLVLEVSDDDARRMQEAQTRAMTPGRKAIANGEDAEDGAVATIVAGDVA